MTGALSKYALTLASDRQLFISALKGNALGAGREKGGAKKNEQIQSDKENTMENRPRFQHVLTFFYSRREACDRSVILEFWTQNKYHGAYASASSFAFFSLRSRRLASRARPSQHIRPNLAPSRQMRRVASLLRHIGEMIRIHRMLGAPHVATEPSSSRGSGKGQLGA